ncbi:hypothetical protein DPX16_0353 [Anabarilius grahami]|uniref:Uncharacterized protein n=1 Tax=Anabarilius grahami TaxID=495550 RepID=A0A3N0XZQ9_ANAGA|nr:hypothetical protein DPX16_0353 [Anabarilius grahami]
MSINCSEMSAIVDGRLVRDASEQRGPIRRVTSECRRSVGAFLLVLLDRSHGALMSAADRSAGSRCISNKLGLFVFGTAVLALL